MTLYARFALWLIASALALTSARAKAQDAGNDGATSRAGRCTGPGECPPDAANCVDGYCCSSACTGPCSACNGADLGWPGAVNGICNAAVAGYPGRTSCEPYLCNSGNSACPQFCATTGSCAPKYYCANAKCVEKKPNGASCAAECNSTNCEVCSSGLCVDSVCCDALCDGACVACTASLRGTTGNNGECGAVVTGQTGRALCPSEALDSCGRTGACDGAGQCALYARGLECSMPTCARDKDGTDFAGTYHCDGDGGCAHDFVFCPAGCEGVQCRSNCPGGSECDAGSGPPCDASNCKGTAPLTPHCGADGTTLIDKTGQEHSCGNYMCGSATETSDPACLIACQTIDDCAPPYVCLRDHTCAPPPYGSGHPSSPPCSVGLLGDAPRNPSWLVAALALAGAITRRKKRAATALPGPSTGRRGRRALK